MALSTKGVAQQSLQDALLDAMDYLAQEKMDKLTLDKTIVAIIVKRKDVINNTYYINYQDNSNLVARAQDDTVYKNGQQVYVLVPQNDLSNDKLILGTASVDNANAESNFISSVMNDYTYSGESAFKKNVTSFGLHSWWVKDSQVLYVSDDFQGENKGDYASLKNQYEYNEKFLPSVKGSEKIMLKAEFRTDLALKHRIPTCGGEYGLKVLLEFKTGQVDYYVDKEGRQTNENGDAYTDRDEGVTPVYKKKHQMLTLESSSSAFTGQPFNYPSFTEQYAIFDFDAENFLGIDSVAFYSQGFTPTDPANNTTDIWVKNVQIYTLSRITSVQGDYSLRLNPSSLVFLKTKDKSEKTPEEIAEDKLLTVSTKADFRKKTVSLSNDSRMKFVWGREDKTVTSLSGSFNGYLGSGWRYLPNAGSTCQFVTRKNENRAYENRYKCSAIYSGDNDANVILVDTFVVYNMDSAKDIKITSNLGEKFAFDMGAPMLTCSVDGETNGDKFKNYSFAWSIAENDGVSRQVISEEEAEAELLSVKNRLNNPSDGNKVSIVDLTTAKNNLALASGVKYGSGTEDEQTKNAHNFLTLPVSSITSSAVVYCTVYEYDADEDDRYCIGTASITLTNSKSIEAARYHIIIENGNQSFQYSETGVSPCDEQYYGQNYQKILPLSCHFFSPNGLEIPASEYVIQWVVPNNDTFLIVGEKEDKNSADDTGEKVSNSQVLDFKIQSRWRYAYTNRQFTAIVTYHGEEFRKDTEFLFTKIGDNGTNGTDYVIKIVPSDSQFFPLPINKEGAYYEKSYLPAVYLKHPTEGDSEGFNVDGIIYRPTLVAELYQRGTKISYEECDWSIAKSGMRSKVVPLQVSSNGALSKVDPWPSAGSYYQGQVVRVSTKVNTEVGDDDSLSWDTIYGFYPIPVVRSYIRNGIGYLVSLNKTYTMQQVLYNSDGKFPQYDTDQGFKIDGIFTYNSTGGDIQKVEDVSSFSLGIELYGGKLESQATSNLASFAEVEGQDETPAVLRRYAITPHESYNGQYQNNGVHLTLKSNGNVLCEVWVPVYLSLNRYSLASLNKWDGNSIEIESNEGNRSYILAPQIGAGIKGEDNSFTGIVMGSRFESVENEEGHVTEQNDVGLFGYHEGKQSIFLDAETGNAVFGLPENKPDEGNGNYEGRIVLTPGGKSTIANLTLASNTLYGASKLTGSLDWTSTPEQETVNGNIVRYWPKKDGYLTKTTAATKSNGVTDVSIDYSSDYFDHLTYDRDLGAPYTDYPVIGAKLGIPEKEQGILLSSTPPYFSAKGHPLTRSNSDIDWDNGLCLMDENDSLEVEIDPNKTSIFTIYQHQDGRRSPLVGIDENGSFYTNSVKQENTTMTINRIGAFGFRASNWSRGNDNQFPNYIGVNFSYDRATIIKLFEPTNTRYSGGYENYTYLTTGTSIENEYARGLRINAKSFESYVTTDSSTSTTTSHKLILTQTEDFYGSENDTFLRMNQGTKNGAYLALKKQDGTAFYGLDIKLTTGQDRTTELANGGQQHLKFTLNSKADNVVLKSGNNANLGLFEGNNGYARLQRDNSRYLEIDSSSGVLKVGNGNMTLKDESFNLSIGTYKNILSANITENGKATGNVLLQRTSSDGTLSSKLLLDASASLTTTDSILLKANTSIEERANTSINIYTRGSDDRAEESTRNYIKMNKGSDFTLHAEAGTRLVLHEKTIGNMPKLSGSTFSNNVAILGNTGETTNKGLCFNEAPKGLIIEHYKEDETDGNVYVFRRNTSDVDPKCALLLKDGGLCTTSIDLRENDSDLKPKSMGKSWFVEIQKLYNSGIGKTDGDGYIGFNGTTLQQRLTDLGNSISDLSSKLGGLSIPKGVGTSATTSISFGTWDMLTVKGTDGTTKTIYWPADTSAIRATTSISAWLTY